MSKSIVTWLITCSFLVLLIIIAGGITRLTGSGLSMVDWHPIYGILPPLTHSQWLDVFVQYQQFPEYKLINNGFTLSEFKTLFFWEYLHRILGRLIGLSLIIPYIVFWFRGKLINNLKKKGAVMIFLVILQGLLGWYMVKSGLSATPHVSHFRLAAHLLLAFFLLQYILWTLYTMLFPKQHTTHAKHIYYLACGVTGLVVLQVMYGAFTAGLKAGYGYNSFPTMNGQWVPEGMMMMRPFWDNFVSNKITVQFGHRLLAWLLVLSIPLFYLASRKYGLLKPQLIALKYFISALTIQFLLGVGTILFVIPLPLAILHQLGAVFVLSSSVYLVYVSR